MTNQPNSKSSAAYSNTPNCLVCGEALDLRQTQGRSSHKPSLMFVCPADARHFRAFVTYRPYVEAVLGRLAALPTNDGDTDNSESLSEDSEDSVK